MSIFAHTTPPGRAKTERVASIALFYAFLLVCMVVGQLFGFEKFIPLLESFGLFGGQGGATLVAGLLVVSEVFALPFLLRMYVSPLMRVTSMILGWVVPVVWIWIALSLNLMGSVDPIGFFGTKLAMANGWWTVLFGVALAILSAWASWGMWPKRDVSRHHSK
jgi:hypothetical protein